MSFLAEQRIARLRQRGSKLFLPLFFLFLSCFAATFLSLRFNEPWQINVLVTTCVLVALIFWLVPVLRFLSTYLDVTNVRIIYRAGLMGQTRFEIALSQIKDVQLTRGRTMILVIEGQEPFSIKGIAGHKKVALEIDRLAASM